MTKYKSIVPNAVQMLPSKPFQKNQSAQAQQYPGQKLGMSLQQTRDFVESQIKSIGITQQISVGQNEIKITLPGDAAYFLGLGFNETFLAAFTLNVNNTIVHENIALIFATVGINGGLGQQPYFGVNMPVSGQDSIKLIIGSAVTPINPSNILVYYK